MQDRIAYRRPDGGISIINPTPGTSLEEAKRSVPADALAAYLVPAHAIPTDRTYRDAWGVDLGKAREIHRNRIRAARAPMLAHLDGLYHQADERGDADAKRAIARHKQALRDATADPRIEAAQTVQELQEIWPLPPMVAELAPPSNPPPAASLSGPPAGQIGMGPPAQQMTDLPRVPSWSIKGLLRRVEAEEVVRGPDPVPPPPPVPELPPGPLYRYQEVPPSGVPPMESAVPALPQQPPNDAVRRGAAKARVQATVSKAAENTFQQQMRYELAMQAKNRNAEAMQMFEPEAKVLRLTVAQLADRVIADRQRRERRMMMVYEIQARAFLNIDAAQGDAIDEVAHAAVEEINAGE